MKELEQRAEAYANATSKNDTYRQYLKNAFIAGYLAAKNGGNLASNLAVSQFDDQHVTQQYEGR